MRPLAHKNEHADVQRRVIPFKINETGPMTPSHFAPSVLGDPAQSALGRLAEAVSADKACYGIFSTCPT
jgi:hypothetical protein